MNRPARRIVAVGSGKGGVGKSTVALNVALALVDERTKVGLLDADVFGPNIPRMMNVTRPTSASAWDLARNPAFGAIRIEPFERWGLQVVSSAFVIGEDHPLTLASALVDLIVRQFFYDVAWKDLDYLLVDLPPGTADLHQTLVRNFPLDAAVVVVTPEDIAHLDGRKAVEMFRRANIAVVGGVENMAGLSCPYCHEEIDMLPRAAPERTVWARGVDNLGSVAFSHEIAQGAESGVPIVVSAPSSDGAQAFRRIAEQIVHRLLADVED